MIPHQVWVNRLGLALFVFLMFLVAQPAVYSQTIPQEELLPIVHPIHYVTQLPNQSPIMAEPMYGGIDGTVIAYEAWLNNNWEINVTSTGFDVVNVTNHPAADINPRLNPGSKRVVFSSNRTGNFEIYSVQTDGTGLRQLTFHTAADLNPGWSPNGQQIVFESQRDGQSELYVMNADGTGLVRLTTDADFDGFPAWSPDGSQIAFSSRRTGGYRLYLFTIATGQIQQITYQPYSSYPVWAPDGSKIIFSGDYNQNGWFELWQVTLNNGTENLILENSSLADAFASAWSPDGQVLIFTEVMYVIAGHEQFVVSDIQTRAWHTVYNGFYYFNDQQFLTGFTDWATGDITPPQSMVQPFSHFTKISQANVNWTAIDPPAPHESFLVSGVDSFDVQYQMADSNTWVDWQIDQLVSGAFFPAEGGQTVSFRSRARDIRDNVESWGEADTTTTFYAWQFEGAIADNRGRLFAYQPFTVVPETLTSSSNNTGSFQALLKTATEHTFNITRPGYDQWPPTTLYSELPFLTYLPPQDNLLENSSFEMDDLADWQTTGNLPTIPTTLYPHSGQTALKAGQICSSNCFAISHTIPSINNLYTLFYSTIDAEGNFYLFWNEFHNDEDMIYFAWRNNAGIWSEKQLLATRVNSFTSKIVVDKNRTIHLVWAMNYGEGQKIYYVSRPWGQNSQPKVTVTADHDEILGFEVNQNNQPVLVTTVFPPSNEREYRFFTRTSTGQWVYETSPFFYRGGGLLNFLYAGADNSLYFFWSNEANGHQYGLRLSDGRRIAPRPIPNQIENYILVGVAPTPNREKFYLFFAQGWATYYQIFDIAQGWSEPQIIPPNFEYVYENANVDDFGNIYVIKKGTTLGLQSYHPSTGWLPLQNLPEYIHGKVVIDQLLIPHLTGMSLTNFDYISLAPAATAGTAAWSQTITLPVTMTNPTLSFMYQTARDVPGDETGLQVQISNDLTPTVQILPPAAGWELAWLDVSQWTGQQVTVTFQLNQATDAPQMELYLDDVSLGSALPDVWVGLESNVGALPGETVVYHLNYGNLSGVTAVSPTITLTLPAPLTFISATVPPLTSTNSALVWSTADLPAQSTGETIVITAVVSNEATLLETYPGLVEIAVPEEEVEQANNQLQLRLFIGRYQFLPLIVRD